MREQLDRLNAAIQVLRDNIARTENKAMLKFYREELKKVEAEHAAIVECNMR